jgi:Holliday junction resolvase RusA-like endonuclease
VTFVFKTKARRDFDNFVGRMKPIWDGIVDSGVIKDDSCWVLQISLRAEHSPRDKSKKGPYIRIELEGAPQGV